MAIVTLNHYDRNGVVDSDEMVLSDNAVSDIIDKAADVILARRGHKYLELKDFLDELDEALKFHGVISDE